MLETKQQKQHFFGVITLIIILTFVSLWDRSSFRYTDTVFMGSQAQTEAYLKYLQSLNIDQKASKDLFQEIISEEDIRKELEADLQVSQPVLQPVVDERVLAITSESGEAAVIDYLARSTGLALNFSAKTSKATTGLFSGDSSISEEVLSEYLIAAEELLKTQTPKEAVGLQKPLVAMYAAYGRVLELSKQYSLGEQQNPWPEVYQQYAIINEQARQYSQQLQKLDSAYKFAGAPVYPYYAQTGGEKFQLIKTAHAFLGVGDVSITVGDIPRIIKEAVEEGLTTAFSQFMGQFLQKVIAKIESNYLIANFLYYSDALVAGQYTDDYLTKYVADSVDRKIIKKFIPQLTCGQTNQDLRPVFVAKAQEYLGFDPSTIRTNDPEYYTKMARVGNFLSTPSGWESHYQDLAAQAASQAEKAAQQELVSPGLKTPRDSIKSSIAISVNNIVSAQRASLQAVMQLGISTAKSFISSVVASLTQTLVNQFVFRGAVSSQGAIGVLKEQSTCLAAAQLELVLPAANTMYTPPAPAPSRDDLLEQECAKLPRGCQLDALDSQNP